VRPFPSPLLSVGAGAAAPVAYSPPNYANVKMLMVGEGTNAGTLFRDRSGKLRAMTPSGSAQVNTGLSLQGIATSLLSSGSSYLSTPSTSDLQVGTSTDFCVEAYINCTTLPTHGTILSKRDSSSGTLEFDFFVQNDGTLAFETYAASFVVAGHASGGAISTGTNYHVAASRQGTTLRIFVNGAFVATGTQSGTINAGTAALYVGRDGTGGNLYNGNLNFVRFTVGQALYTAAFVPPVAADFFAYVEGTGPKVGLNAYDKAANIALSNGWRTATKTTADALNSVRATRGIAYTDSGYFEVRIDQGTASTFMVMGIGNSSASLTSYPGGDANGWGYYQDDGHKYTNGADAGAMGATYKTNGDIVQIAFKNGSLWFGKNNTWNGNPAANTGAAFTGITGTLYPMLALYNTTNLSLPHIVTARFHAWEQTYSAPSGFNAWDA